MFHAWVFDDIGISEKLKFDYPGLSMNILHMGNKLPA